MTDNERELLKKLTVTVSALCQVVAARDPFGTLGKLSQDLETLLVAVVKDAQAPKPAPSAKHPRGWREVES